MKTATLAILAALVLAGCDSRPTAVREREGFKSTVKRLCPQGAREAVLNSRDGGPDIRVVCR